MLADFRAWLSLLAEPAAVEPLAVEPVTTRVDLATLVGQFVALRHEVNLQTKNSRTQLEQNAQALQNLTNALSALEHQQMVGKQDDAAAEEELLRPLFRTLVELYDALALGQREVQRMQESLGPTLAQFQSAVEARGEEPSPQPAAPAVVLPWWARWLGLQSEVDRQKAALDAWWKEKLPTAVTPAPSSLEHLRTLGERIRQAVQSILTGYAMGLQRVDRALRQHGLEPIGALGRFFDPELMEVLEAVPDSGRPAGQVLEEIRRGYLWRERVFRFAQVKVARS